MTNFLFGPIPQKFAQLHLGTHLPAGTCLPLDYEGPVSLSGHASWESFSLQFSPGWQPDYLALYLLYRSIPEWIWDAPIPIIGLAGDWNLLWHHYRGIAPLCDFVMTDLPGMGEFDLQWRQEFLSMEGKRWQSVMWSSSIRMNERNCRSS